MEKFNIAHYLYLGGDCKYVFPPEMEEELNRRHKKKLVKTEKQLINNIIRNDKRHLKYVNWYKAVKAVKIFAYLKIDPLKLNPLKGYVLFQNEIEILVDTVSMLKILTELSELEKPKFLEFYKEQTK